MLFTRDSGLNDVIVHELICSVYWWKCNKRLKGRQIVFFFYLWKHTCT